MAPGTAPEACEQIIDTWSKETAEALAPSALKVFARSRWCTSGSVAAETFLLSSCHGILEAAVPIWLRRLGGTGKKDLPTSWSEDATMQMVGHDPPCASEGNTLWAEFNHQQRVGAHRLAQSPLARAGWTLWHSCMAPAVWLMDRLLACASAKWDREQEYQALKEGQRSFRIIDARGKWTEASWG